jgi:catalase
VADWYNRNETEDDHFTQPGMLYRNAMNEQDRIHLISNIVSSMKKICGDKKEEIINRQLCHFFRADIQLGMAVAKGLDIAIDEKTMDHAKK